MSLLESDLQRLLENPPQGDQAVAKRYEMRADPFDGYQVWAGSGGLRIPAGEWHEMVSLLERGAAMSSPSAAASGALRALAAGNPSRPVSELSN